MPVNLRVSRHFYFLPPVDFGRFFTIINQRCALNNIIETTGGQPELRSE